MGKSWQSVLKKASKKKRNAAEIAAAVRMYRGVSSVPSSTRTRKPSRHQACQHLAAAQADAIHDVDVVLAVWNLAIAISDKQPKGGPVTQGVVG